MLGTTTLAIRAITENYLENLSIIRYGVPLNSRVNNLEAALMDCLRQLEKAINGNEMDGDWIAAELHGRECLFDA
jgi:hypothetical protein